MAALPAVVKDRGSQENFDKLNGRFPVAAADLSTGAKELFPQLTTPGAVKLNRGVVTVTWTGTTFSPTIEVLHGLGAEPISIVLGVEKIGALFAYFDYKEVNSTRFKIEGAANSSVTNGTESKVSWIAIG